MLRFEIRFNSRLKEQMKKTVKLYHLYDEDFFLNILNIWKESYFGINKLKILNNDIQSYRNFKNYKDHLLVKCIHEMGLDNILKDIDNNRDLFNSSPEASRTKIQIKKLVNNNKYTGEHDLIKELDDKILEVVSFYGLGRKVA